MLDIESAIRHCEEVAEKNEVQAEKWREEGGEEWGKTTACRECAADHRQLAAWLRELKEAKCIIRVCNRVLGYLLECEIESTSTRHEVETLLKNITEYLSGGSEDDD